MQSLLVRLQISAESWLETVARFGRQFHRAVGLADHLKVEAERLGVNWLPRPALEPSAIRVATLSLTPPVSS